MSEKCKSVTASKQHPNYTEVSAAYELIRRWWTRRVGCKGCGTECWYTNNKVKKFSEGSGISGLHSKTSDVATTRIRQKAVVRMQNKRNLNLLSVKSSDIWSPLRKIINLVPYLRTCLNKVSPLSLYKKMTHLIS